MAAFEYRQAEEIRDVFAHHGVRYLFIGKSGAILLGYPDTTQDADVFLEKAPEHGHRIVAALKELGFSLTDAEAAEVERGKDFVQLRNGPFDRLRAGRHRTIRGRVAAAGGSGGVLRLPSGRHHREQGGGEPPQGSGVAGPIEIVP